MSIPRVKTVWKTATGNWRMVAIDGSDKYLHGDDARELQQAYSLAELELPPDCLVMSDLTEAEKAECSLSPNLVDQLLRRKPTCPRCGGENDRASGWCRKCVRECIHSFGLHGKVVGEWA